MENSHLERIEQTNVQKTIDSTNKPINASINNFGVAFETITVEQWSEYQVKEWFESNQIDQRLINDLTPCTGIVLKELYEMRRDAPEAFFQTLNSNKDVKFLPSVLKFCHCLKTIFESFNY